jgi:hypothetical protein
MPRRKAAAKGTGYEYENNKSDDDRTYNIIFWFGFHETSPNE